MTAFSSMIQTHKYASESLKNTLMGEQILTMVSSTFPWLNVIPTQFSIAFVCIVKSILFSYNIQNCPFIISYDHLF